MITGGMIGIEGKMPKVKPKFSRCFFCGDKLTAGTSIMGLIDYDPTQKDPAAQLNIYYAHPVCLKHKIRTGDIKETPPKHGAEWIKDRHVKWFWLHWAELKGIGWMVRAMMPR